MDTDPGAYGAAFADVLATAFKEAMKRTPTQPGRSPVRLLGPAECPVFRLNNFYRFHFQVQSDSSAVLHEVLRNVLALAKPPSGVTTRTPLPASTRSSTALAMAAPRSSTC